MGISLIYPRHRACFLLGIAERGHVLSYDWEYLTPHSGSRVGGCDRLASCWLLVVPDSAKQSDACEGRPHVDGEESNKTAAFGLVRAYISGPNLV